MYDPFGKETNSHWIPFTDFLASVLAIFLVVSALLIVYLKDPTQDKKKGEIQSPGSIMVEIDWTKNVDVDLWVKSPQDFPVGYQRKQGLYFDLLHDDLGYAGDRVNGHHHEDVFARNTPQGEYIVNIALYSLRGEPMTTLPIEVIVAVEIIKHNTTSNNSGKTEEKDVIHTKVNLIATNQEITVVRFRLDGNENVEPNSINYEPIPLRGRTFE